MKYPKLLKLSEFFLPRPYPPVNCKINAVGPRATGNSCGTLAVYTLYYTSMWGKAATNLDTIHFIFFLSPWCGWGVCFCPSFAFEVNFARIFFCCRYSAPGFVLACWHVLILAIVAGLRKDKGRAGVFTCRRARYHRNWAIVKCWRSEWQARFFSFLPCLLGVMVDFDWKNMCWICWDWWLEVWS